MVVIVESFGEMVGSPLKVHFNHRVSFVCVCVFWEVKMKYLNFRFVDAGCEVQMLVIQSVRLQTEIVISVQGGSLETKFAQKLKFR